MSKGKQGRYRLGEPLDGMLLDFSAAHFGAPDSEIIRQALKAFIESELAANPGIRDRYEAARSERLQQGGKVARLKPVE